ncbi:cell wall-associated NlpC family hydrolase [Saccharothrix tamanrassetensis]|uniref:Cell wall-associated NlpC family hydrolase n=1 Tax=Saccharothrix tamanrassetensis TaxID=1051531 RepID=A0A841CB30_9PSEU|nr:NlpC/P60 family protein [Saccharothrix tamanrassetensis]MBB5954190.1 cell wall-associated NlpC family hydrolase [Saccharothrix tamanrassetensis]
MARWVIMVVATLLLFPGVAPAVPPPPPNPSDGEISAGREQADAKAARVGELTGQLTEAEARLQRLTDDVAFKMELANKARVDLDTARDEAAKAEQDAATARTEAEVAGKAVDDARRELDEFAAASFQQGSTIGSLSAYFGASSPEDLLARSSMLAAVGDSGLNALDDVERARAEQANKDSAARAALDLANQKQVAAEQAGRDADAARQAAVQAQQDQAGQAAAIEGDKTRVEGELAQALTAVEGLEGQRAQYDQWLDDKRREEEEAARQAALNAAKPAAKPAAPAARPVVTAPSGGGVETVVARAMEHLGVRYSWGGGNYDGPTVGIRDGGVGDSYGDYYSVGFDCSGLMMYAFAGVGIYLAHYSGYQYNAGRKVPLDQAQRGDMLFWGPGGGTHVALYLGGGMMIEAPYSGSWVRIAPVRYGGIMPYATRLL